MSISCRLGIHRWHYYTTLMDRRRRCTKVGCTRDMVAP